MTTRNGKLATVVEGAARSAQTDLDDRTARARNKPSGRSQSTQRTL